MYMTTGETFSCASLSIDAHMSLGDQDIKVIWILLSSCTSLVVLYTVSFNCMINVINYANTALVKTYL